PKKKGVSECALSPAARSAWTPGAPPRSPPHRPPPRRGRPPPPRRGAPPPPPRRPRAPRRAPAAGGAVRVRPRAPRPPPPPPADAHHVHCERGEPTLGLHSRRDRAAALHAVREPPDGAADRLVGHRVTDDGERAHDRHAALEHRAECPRKARRLHLRREGPDER